MRLLASLALFGAACAAANVKGSGSDGGGLLPGDDGPPPADLTSALSTRDLAQPDDLPPPDDLAPPPDLLGRGPTVYASPGAAPALWNGAWARALTVTLATEDPTATIYYTTDGSMPTLASAHALSPVSGINIDLSATVRAFSINASGRSLESQTTYPLDATLQAKAGYIATNTSLGPTGPVLVAMPGQALTATTSWQIWVQSGCPACRAQLVYGFDTTDQGCLYDNAAGLYPGQSATAATFKLTAPTQAGVHELKLAHIEQTSCAAAMAQGALATRPTVARIAVVSVQ